MNKGELIKMVAEEAGVTQKEAGRVIDATTEVIRRALRRGEKVNLVGFGSFEVRSRAARRGRNPRTGTMLQIKARRAPAFRPGKPLRDAINH